MKSYQTLYTLFTTLTQNTSTANSTLGKQLINDQHRYLIQKFFDNESTTTFVTIGAEDLTLTGALLTGATSGTLSSAWTSISCKQLVVFSNDEQRTVSFTQGSTAISWTTGLTSAATTAISTIGVQSYPLPADVSKVKNVTINVGQLVYTPAPVQTIDEWTRINALPYTSDIPNYYYIYNNQINIWPIPSTSGNVGTVNYKRRVADMNYLDYTTGTISSATVGSNAITGSGTSWTAYPQNVDLSYVNLKLQIWSTDGDMLWYPIQRFTSATTLLLGSPIQNLNELTSATYTIAQFPLLQEDFHDMIVYGALVVYFTSIVQAPDKAKMFQTMYDQKLELLEAYAGNKSVNVDLGQQPMPMNPNLFLWGTS